MATLILQVAGMDEPPQRLLAGTDSFAYAAAADSARRQADEKWKWLSVSAAGPIQLI